MVLQKKMVTVTIEMRRYLPMRLRFGCIDNNRDAVRSMRGDPNLLCDKDGDGFGDPDDTIESCDVLEGYVVGGNDCDDDNDTVFPAAEELCDGLDNDCDETIDEDVGDLFYIDADGDGI